MHLKRLFGINILILLACFATANSNIKISKTQVEVNTNKGTLVLLPMTDNAVRVTFFETEKSNLEEFVFTQTNGSPKFKVNNTAEKLTIVLSRMRVELDKANNELSFYNNNGQIILRENANARVFNQTEIMGEKCYFVEQTFHSPSDESIFGLGQFQDGNYDLKGIARRLTQVNSQIAIPFIYSNKGYGLLWHQYGLTDFNPADNFVTLTKQAKQDEAEKLVETTTTAGTQKVAQNQSLYQGKLIVPQDGEYSIFLDLGDMGNRHFVSINGKAVIDQSNMWLPPTAGTLVHLKAGEHDVQLICKSDNKPQLSWKLKDNSTVFRSPHAKALDYVVFAGSADDVIASYRKLSGNAPLFPKWAYGFWQCRERYTSANHLIETVKEFRKRQLPMDVIVQDWQYWGNKGWGVPQFDERHYPNPTGFIKEIHDLNAHFCISIWSNPDKNSEIGKQYVANNRFVPDTKWLDYYNPATRNEYWGTLKTNMFDHGVDSWWMDAVEPENDALRGTKTHIGLGDFYRLTYPLLVSKAVYEGQRNVTDDKRVCILTRSAFSGQQRYGVINWSGDIGGDWDAYKRQIVAGLNFSITGLPYWTTDIGGFFRPGNAQYTDKNFHELLLRWFQWGTFNPVFRMHGYMSETEPWKYGAEMESNMRQMLNLRYRLLPYIYSEAWQITSNGSTLMRPMVMDFANDKNAVAQAYQYMFGQSILVTPTIEADVRKQKVYLPNTDTWYDFWTGKKYDGGQTVMADAAIDKIALFVKAGSILPMGKTVQHSGESNNEMLEIRIYKGKNGKFELYEDAGNNYDYEQGAYNLIAFTWDDKKQTLTIDTAKGNWTDKLTKRTFNIVLVNENTNNGMTENTGKNIEYKNKKVSVKF